MATAVDCGRFGRWYGEMNSTGPIPLQAKSTTEEIRARFDDDVERFSSLETGQAATIDAPLAMELITRAAVAASRPIRRLLDIGCGAGNNSIRLAREYGGEPFAVDLCDLSTPMLARAQARLGEERVGLVRTFAGDFRELPFADGAYDVILAAAVFHHLRDDTDWEAAFSKVFRLLRPGGSVWITDLVAQESPAVHRLMWERYGDYLEGLAGAEYRQKVFAYIDAEDSPRPVTWQLELLRRVGFGVVEILHKHSCFAAFGAIKAAD